MAGCCLPLRENMDEKVYLAKSPLPDGRTVSNKEHLSAVAELARCFAAACGLMLQAFICGNLHDFGKYGERFCGVLRGTWQGIDHAFSSAVFLYANERKHLQTFGPLIEAIAAHHDGLHSWMSLKELFEERNAASVKIATLLDKPEGRLVEIEADYTCFTIPNEFVVGYGLDYDENYRNLPYVGVLKEEVYSK